MRAFADSRLAAPAAIAVASNDEDIIATDEKPLCKPGFDGDRLEVIVRDEQSSCHRADTHRVELDSLRLGTR